MTKTGRGWWTLSGMVVLLPLVLYVAAYFALVHERGHFSDFPSGEKKFSIIAEYGPLPLWRIHPVLESLFWPMHQIDRRLRPRKWL